MAAARWASIIWAGPVGGAGGGPPVRKRSRTASRFGWPKEKTLPPGEKTIRATSTPHRVQSSLAFLKRPDLRFENVTWRLFSFSIFFMSIFWRPLLFFGAPVVLFELDAMAAGLGLTCKTQK